MDFNIILIVVASLAIIVNIFCFSMLFSQRREIEAMKKENQKQLRMISSSVVGMGNRILDSERRLASVRKDQKVLSDTQQDFSYSKAKKLIEQGVQLEAVAASSGLSLSEVQLIKLIHSQSSIPSDNYS